MNLTIPTNLYPTSYNGLGSIWKNASQSLAPQFTDFYSNYNNNVNNAFNQAQGGIQGVLSNQIAPAIQGNINNLAGRNMLNSSVASDTLSKTMTGITNNQQAQNTALNTARMTSLLDLGKQLMSGAGLSQYSENSNPLAPYQMMAELIQGMQ